MKRKNKFKEIIISNVGKLNKEDILSDRINDWMDTMIDSHFDFYVDRFQYQTTETRHSVLIFYTIIDLEEYEKEFRDEAIKCSNEEVPTPEEIMGFTATTGLNPETGEWGHNA